MKINRQGVLGLMVLAGVIATLGPYAVEGEPKPVAATVATIVVTPPEPHGIPGSWRLVWHDEFGGDQLNTDRWRVPTDWHINNVTPSSSNVWVYGDRLVLNLSSSTSGGAVIGRTIRLDPGEVVEARIRFPGSDSGDHIYNFPAFWAVGVRYPNSGEHDIAEGLGDLKVTYWTGAKTIGCSIFPAGDWNNVYHTFGIHRGYKSVSYWWDGIRVKRCATADDGGPEYIILNVGSHPKRTLVTGKPSRVFVDYVGLWRQQ